MKKPIWASIQIDEEKEIITICGIKYSFELFQQFGGALPIDATFKLVERDGFGGISVQRIDQ